MLFGMIDLLPSLEWFHGSESASSRAFGRGRWARSCLSEASANGGVLALLGGGHDVRSTRSPASEERAESGGAEARCERQVLRKGIRANGSGSGFG